jgi:hypothetical protein
MSYFLRLEDLFYAQGVDLVLQAHEHSYERLWPVYDYQVIAKNYVDPRAPVHVISGAAGCGENVDFMGDPSKNFVVYFYQEIKKNRFLDQFCNKYCFHIYQFLTCN